MSSWDPLGRRTSACRESLDEEGLWLHERLMVGGPLHVVEDIRQKAAAGKLSDLRQAMRHAKVHGEEFLEALDSVPMGHLLSEHASHARRRSVETKEKASKGGDSKDMGIWSWAERKLEEMERAEGKLAEAAADAREVVRNVGRVCARAGVQLEKRQKALEAEAQQENSPSVSRSGSARLSPGFNKTSSLKSPTKKSVVNSGNKLSVTKPALLGGSGGSGLWLRAHTAVLGGRPRASGTPFDLLSVSSLVRAQASLTPVAEELKRCLEATSLSRPQEGLQHSEMPAGFQDGGGRRGSTGTWLHTQSLKVVAMVKDMQARLYSRFLECVRPHLLELKQTAEHAQCLVPLERNLRVARRVQGARTLLGADGIGAINAAGFGLVEDEEEPLDPWAMHREAGAPWEATILAACRRVALLRETSVREGSNNFGHTTSVREATMTLMARD